MKTRKLELSEPEYQHITVTLEGAIEELEELMRDNDFYTTELTERLAQCLEILERAE